ncbi:MAG TPA: response regulator [Pyrinomonadaceae bacterium]|nr:response regulator [Pyrinomonadaceae bacterium]
MAKILLIEDEPDNREVIKMLLEMEQHQIIECINGEDGVKQAIAEKPDLVLMDISLPGAIDGLQATQILRGDSSFEAIPIIALTANAMRGDRESALAAGCDVHIPKPIEDLHEFAKTVTLFLKNGRSAGV